LFELYAFEFYITRRRFINNNLFLGRNMQAGEKERIEAGGICPGEWRE
jgi:hypothetical protein